MSHRFNTFTTWRGRRFSLHIKMARQSHSRSTPHAGDKMASAQSETIAVQQPATVRCKHW
jgi:hypothetical protein